MNRKLLLAFDCTLAICQAGCYYGVTLRPIQGPSPKAYPLMDPRGAFKSGRFYVDLDNISKPLWHEQCVGQWERPVPPKLGGSGRTSDANELATTWDIVYGAGYYEKTVMNAKLCARGSGKSKNGTTLEAEMCQFEEQLRGKLRITKRGVARDNNDNVYQIE
jgi:hypothetical protein